MKKGKCKNCTHCDITNMKCYPQSKDCHKEYDLSEDDLETEDRCDFYERKLESVNK